MTEPEYHTLVNRIEDQLRKCAKKSFDSPIFIDGGDVFAYYADQWLAKEAQLKLRHRTPIQLQRDRILYSQGMRKQTEKYHVLYNGQRRIVRAYATHTMRMAQVARAICRGLDLNQDFAEAIALGAKIGAVPFIHASKYAVSAWAEEKIGALDRRSATADPLRGQAKQQLTLDFESREIPGFVTRLQSSTVLDKVKRYMPWAAGYCDAKPYTSGQESYWLLCTNPFTTEAHPNAFFPETMYGIWRHTRGLLPGSNPFFHKCALLKATKGYNQITDHHATFEATVVQYADDITWVIENLNDANDVTILNNQMRTIYDGLADELGHDIDAALQRALTKNDAGGLYNYFISNFVRHSDELLKKPDGELKLRAELSAASTAVHIGLSPEAEAILTKMVKYLNDQVFVEPRTKNRTELLKSISSACVDLIYKSGDVLPRVVTEQARLGRWNEDTKRAALELLDDEIHKIQISMDVLASWGDQEIYDFVGIQSL